MGYVVWGRCQYEQGGGQGGREGPVPGYRGHVVMWSCDLVLS